MAPLGRGGDGGDALYRSLVLEDGAIAVTVELLSRRGGAAPRTIHRGRCGLPPDPEQTAERVRLLLEAADRAVAQAVAAARGRGDAAAGRGRPSQRRLHDDAPRDATREGGVSDGRHEREDGLREHARREAAAAA